MDRAAFETGSGADHAHMTMRQLYKDCKALPFSSQHASHAPKQFTVRGSQCFKEWSPWCWMVWSGSRPACLPLPFICLPVLFICLPSSVLVVGFPVLSPTSFHLSPSSFLLSPSSCHLSPQAGCLWSGSRLACLPLPFICLPLLFICLPGWVLVVGFPAGLSPTSFHLSPSSFHLSPKLGACGRVPGLVSHFLSFVSQFFSFVSQAGCLWSGSRLLSPTSFHLSPSSFLLSPSSFHLSPRLGACGRVPGWLVSHFFSFVSHFFSFVSQAGCLWSGSRLACLPLPFIVSHFFSFFVPTSFHLSPSSFHLSPRLGACGRVPGWLVSHFLSYVSHFFSFVSQAGCSQAGCLWSGSRLACLPLPVICLPLLFICLPGWVLVVGFPAGLSPTSFHLSPGSRLACLALPFICLLLLFICLLSFHFFVSQARCLWSGSRLSPTSFPTSFHLSPSSFHCLPGWVLVVGFAAGLSPTSFHLSPTSFHLSPTSFHLSPSSFHCLPGWVLVVGFAAGLSPTSFHLSPTSFHLSPTSFHLSPSSFHLSPRLGACGRVPGWLVSHFLSYVSHFFSFFVSQAGCLWSGSRLACLAPSFHLSPFLSFVCLPGSVLVVGFPLVSHFLSHFFSFVSQFFSLSPRLGACGRGFAAGLSPTSFHLSYLSPTSFHCLFICLPGLSLVVSALFRCRCNMFIHLSPSFDSDINLSPCFRHL